MSSYIGGDERSIQRSIVNHVEYTLARTRFNFDNMGAYQATAYSVRDRLIEAWNDTQQYHTVSNNFKPLKDLARSLKYSRQRISGALLPGVRITHKLLCHTLFLMPCLSEV